MIELLADHFEGMWNEADKEFELEAANVESLDALSEPLSVDGSRGNSSGLNG
jgi:hypothetical protein